MHLFRAGGDMRVPTDAAYDHRLFFGDAEFAAIERLSLRSWVRILVCGLGSG
jgi:hypothetical protein